MIHVCGVDFCALAHGARLVEAEELEYQKLVAKETFRLDIRSGRREAENEALY